MSNFPDDINPSASTDTNNTQNYDRDGQLCLQRFDRCTAPLCRPFERDPQASVHKAWGVCLIFILILFIAACLEAKLMQSTYGTAPIVVAAIWTALAQLVMGFIGTFVLRRFPTEFSVGFFLGLLLVVAQQNFILFGAFTDPTFNMMSEQKTSKLFGVLILITGLVYLGFAIMLTRFRDQILLTPIDVKSVITRLGSVSREDDAGGGKNEEEGVSERTDGNVGVASSDPMENYRQFD